jgi:hypothetical protein
LDGIGCALTLLSAMRHEDTWHHEAARRYDTPGSGMFAPPGAGEEIQVRGAGRGVEPAAAGMVEHRRPVATTHAGAW